MKKLIKDVATGIERYVDETPEEIAQREADALSYEAEMLTRQAAEEAKAAAKESAIAKFKAMGLSDEEIAVILP